MYLFGFRLPGNRLILIVQLAAYLVPDYDCLTTYYPATNYNETSYASGSSSGYSSGVPWP
jgi:hypothetical protein